MVAAMDARRGLFEEFAIATALLTRLPIGARLPAARPASGAATSAEGHHAASRA